MWYLGFEYECTKSKLFTMWYLGFDMSVLNWSSAEIIEKMSSSIASKLKDLIFVFLLLLYDTMLIVCKWIVYSLIWYMFFIEMEGWVGTSEDFETLEPERYNSVYQVLPTKIILGLAYTYYLGDCCIL